MTAPAPGIDAGAMSYTAGRGITEVLHFTTHRGLLGIFAKEAVLSRERLEADKYIEHIYLLYTLRVR
ncbi:MAG TPA: hypothetical protein VFQ48_05060 [Pseudonocardiaceae bacterium]|nr:hypothetical protein [Pseudonocardiaceae bacterium]